MRANSRLGSLNLVLIFHGASFSQTTQESDFSNLQSCFNVNCLSTLVFLQSLRCIVTKQGTGTIVVVTSVARVRGRPKTLFMAPPSRRLAPICRTSVLLCIIPASKSMI